MSVNIYNFTKNKLYFRSYYSKRKPCKYLISQHICYILDYGVCGYPHLPRWYTKLVKKSSTSRQFNFFRHNPLCL